MAGAIRTDFILSAEIMAITLASITAPGILTQAIVLFSVGVLVTAGVYGVVAIIVKADDFGVYLAQCGGTITTAIGQAITYGMPPFLKTLSFVGLIAMLGSGAASSFTAFTLTVSMARSTRSKSSATPHAPPFPPLSVCCHGWLEPSLRQSWAFSSAPSRRSRLCPP